MQSSWRASGREIVTCNIWYKLYYLQHIELDDSVSILIESIEGPWGRPKRIGDHISLTKGCISTYRLICSQIIRTEHALEPHEAADVAVKVDVQMLVGVSHRYDVVQLVVEVKSFIKRDRSRECCDFPALFWYCRCRSYAQRGIWWVCCSPASLTAFLISKLLMEQVLSLA